MRKRAIVEKDRRPAMVAGVLMLLAVVLAVVVIGNQFGGKVEGRTQGGGGKEELVNAATGSGRRNIYDRNFMELAVSFQRSSLYVRPLELEDPEIVAREVAKILEVDEKIILLALKGERSFVWLGRDIPREKALRIAELNLKGMYRINQVQRFYPGNQLAAHVLGFLKDEQGLAGVEFYYDSVLRGGGVYEPKLAAAGVNKKIAEGSDSASLILTLDIHLQNILEQKLKGLMANTGSKSGVAVLMAPNTGEIIGLASLPDYDPNRFWEFSAEAHRNRAIDNILDLGVMDRLFQAAAVMENMIAQGKNRMPENDAGTETEAVQRTSWNAVQDGRYISAEGVDFAQILSEPSDFNAFADRIGLTAKGEIDLPEALFASKNVHVDSANKNAGIQAPLSKLAKSMLPPMDKDAVLTATPLALLSSFCRLINGGQVMIPHVLRGVWQGEQLWDVPVRQRIGEFVVRPAVSAAMRSEMKKVAGAERDDFIIESLRQKDFAPPAQAKTTGAKGAQSAKESGANTVPVQPGMESILLGMAPVEDPEIAIIVVLDGAHIDPLAKSPVRNIAEEMMAQVRTSLRNKVIPPTGKELAVRERGYYKKMAMIQANATLPAALAQGPQSLVMPNVLGLSGRKALQTLQPYGVRLQIAGSGQVSSQYPLAGTVIRGAEHGVLHLKAMQ
ncbi:MAG TPA: hypothetical protein DEQ20_06205 [Desulfobulbaceae bacterium]|nr:hypothetical protein [Desulfobulbaceae bacterium]